jgi:hypothetical protein
MKKVFVIASALALTACASQPKPEIIVQQKQVAVKVDRSIIKCPKIERPPTGVDLTNESSNKYTASLFFQYVGCYDSVKKYLEEEDKLAAKIEESSK